MFVISYRISCSYQFHIMMLLYYKKLFSFWLITIAFIQRRNGFFLFKRWAIQDISLIVYIYLSANLLFCCQFILFYHNKYISFLIIYILHTFSWQWDYYIRKFVFCQSYVCVFLSRIYIFNQDYSISSEIVADMHVRMVCFIWLSQQENYPHKFQPRYNVSSNCGWH